MSGATTKHDERIAELIRALIAEPDVMARARLCDAWAGAFLRDLGGEEGAELLCAELLAGAIAAADTLIAHAAERAPGEALH